MNEEQLKKFFEARLAQFFGKNVDSFKEKVNLLRSSEYERESQSRTMCDIQIFDRSYIIDGNRHLYIHDIQNKNTRELVSYYALAIQLLTESNSRNAYGWIFFSYTDTELNQILPLAELYRLEDVANNLDLTLSSNQKQMECRQEVEKLKKRKFISFSLFDYSLFLADVLKTDVLKAIKKVDLKMALPDIAEGLVKFPQKEVVNKSTVVSAVKSDLLDRLDAEHRELNKIKPYLEKDLQKEFPWYGNLLKAKLQQTFDNAFGGEKTLYRAALLEFYNDRFYINEPNLLGMNQQFFKLPVTSGTSKDKSFEVNDSVAKELGKLQL